MKKIKTLPLPVEPAQEPDESWRSIHVPVWKSNLFLYVGPIDRFYEHLEKDCMWPEDEVNRMRAKHKEDATYLTASSFGLDGDVAIWSPTKLAPETLVHELLHAALMLMRSRNCEDEEALCYTLEYLYKEATK